MQQINDDQDTGLHLLGQIRIEFRERACDALPHGHIVHLQPSQLIERCLKFVKELEDGAKWHMWCVSCGGTVETHSGPSLNWTSKVSKMELSASEVVGNQSCEVVGVLRII